MIIGMLLTGEDTYIDTGVYQLYLAGLLCYAE